MVLSSNPLSTSKFLCSQGQSAQHGTGKQFSKPLLCFCLGFFPPTRSPAPPSCPSHGALAPQDDALCASSHITIPLILTGWEMAAEELKPQFHGRKGFCALTHLGKTVPQSASMKPCCEYTLKWGPSKVVGRAFSYSGFLK